MINIVCFKWKRIKTGFQLPTVIDNYGADHVNIMYSSVKRNTTLPFRFVCITDDDSGLHPDIHVLPLWNKCVSIGGCYNRLYMFSKDMKHYIGERFIAIDLDSVIVGNLDSILSRKEDFIINEYNIAINRYATHQYYNGGLIMMNAGARDHVWTKFDPNCSPAELAIRVKNKEIVGSDQAWIAHILGSGESTFSPVDGVYDYRTLSNKHQLPSDAKIVLFPGKRDPASEYNSVLWVRNHWRTDVCVTNQTVKLLGKTKLRNQISITSNNMSREEKEKARAKYIEHLRNRQFHLKN